MAERKDIRSKAQYQAAYELERAGDEAGAIKGYQKASKTDPSNIPAWNRQMILFRKSKSKLQEISLIKTAIFQYKKSIAEAHEAWLSENQEKAENSLQLAKILGLVKSSGMPLSEHPILEKWETRLYLLDYRLKNARTKKTKAAKKPARAKDSKENQPILTKTKPKNPIKPKTKTVKKIHVPKTKK